MRFKTGKKIYKQVLQNNDVQTSFGQVIILTDE